MTFRAEGSCAIRGGDELVITGAGTCTLVASQAGNADWAPAAEVRRVVRVSRAAQDVRFDDPGLLRLDEPPIDLAASADSGLPVTFQAEGPCVIRQGELRATGAGTCTVTAIQVGDDDWAPADPVTRELAIERVPQAISFEPLLDSIVGGRPQTLSASASSGLPVSFQADGPCTITDGQVRPTGAGTCTVTATQAGDADRAPADPVTQDLVIERATQTVEFVPPAETAVGASPQPLSATATSGLPVTFSAEGPCTIVDGRVRPTGAGLCVVSASQAGDADTAPADPVRRVFRIDRAAQIITFADLESQRAGGPPMELSAVASSGLPVTFSADGPCTVRGGRMLEVTGPGTCTVTAHQAGDADRAPASVSRSFEILAPSLEPTDEPSPSARPSLAEVAWPLPCTTWRPILAPDPVAASALESVECLDEMAGISRYALYRFTDRAALAARFTEHVTAAQPPMGTSDEACRSRLPGAKRWEHGWLACWVPDRSALAQLHWTDERTGTYGVLVSTDDRLPRIYRHWQRAYEPEDPESADAASPSPD